MIDKLSRFVREKRGDMSLREFAKICGDISHTQIDNIERGIDPRSGKVVRPTLISIHAPHARCDSADITKDASYTNTRKSARFLFLSTTLSKNAHFHYVFTTLKKCLLQLRNS